MILRRICPLVLGLALALSPTAAKPEPGSRGAIAIAYRDLDLATREGRRALRQRVHEAAARLCRKQSRGEILPFNSACISRAVASAEPQVRLAIRGSLKKDWAQARGDRIAGRRR